MKNVIIKVLTLVMAVTLLYSCGDGKTDSGSRLDQQAACAINQILANGLCSACAINEVTIDNRCVACASNEINVNNICIACASNEVTVNNACVACAVDEVIEDNMCVTCASNEVIEGNMCVACDSNQRVVNGLCENIPDVVTPTDPSSSCPANSSLSGASCLCATNYRAAGTAIGSIGTSCAIYSGDAAHTGGVQTPTSCSGCHSVRVDET